MNTIENSFKKRLLAGDTMTGTFLMTPSPVIAEALAWVGLDFLLIDMEHSPFSVASMQDCLRAIAPTPTASVVRLPGHDSVLIKQVMDAGAQSLMIPMVENPAQATDLVAATRYPPDGYRGFALMQRASRYTSAKDYAEFANDEVCVIAQLESVGVVARLEEISSVPGVDAVFVGPGDLSAAMGHLGNPGAKDVQDLLADAVCRASAAGIACGTVGGTAELARRHLDNGYRMVCISTDLAILVGGARSMLEQVRK